MIELRENWTKQQKRCHKLLCQNRKYVITFVYIFCSHCAPIVCCFFFRRLEVLALHANRILPEYWWHLKCYYVRRRAALDCSVCFLITRKLRTERSINCAMFYCTESMDGMHLNYILAGKKVKVSTILYAIAIADDMYTEKRFESVPCFKYLPSPKPMMCLHVSVYALWLALTSIRCLDTHFSQYVERKYISHSTRNRLIPQTLWEIEILCK